MDLRISLLSFNFVMIHIIHKILVLIKNHMNYLGDNFFKFLFKKYNRLLFFEKKLIFLIIYNDGKFNVWRRNRFRLWKEQNDTAIKDIRNLFIL